MVKNNHSKLRKVLPLALGLTMGVNGIGFAENTIDSTFNTTTGDFIFVTDYMHKTNRNERTDINALVKGGNVKRIYAIDPSEAIRSRINFLNSERGKEFYSGKKDEERLDLIGRYQNFLNELNTKKIAPNKKSLEGLSAAVSDGIIAPEELKNVEDNVYAIVKEGTDKTVGNYAVFYLTRLTSEKTSSQYESKIKELENTYNELAKRDEEQRKKISELEQRTETPELPLQTEKPKQETPVQPQVPKKEKDYRSVYLQAQQAVNGDLTSYITSIGARVNLFEKVDIGFGANLDLGFGLDNLVDSYNGQLSAGRTASGTITDTNKLSIGGSLEAQLGPFVLGGGIDYKTWVRNVVEQILSQSGSVVKSNTNSTPNRQVFGKVYGGFEVEPLEGWKIGTILGYNWKDGLYMGLRTNFKLNQPKKEK